MSDIELGTIDLDTVEPIKTIGLSAIADVPHEQRWLVDNVWPAEGVGLVAATPKIGKTWIAADLGISVASATPFAGHFRVREAGRVLMFASEDQNHEMKDRLRGFATARGLAFDDLAFQLVDEPILTLNRAKDLARFERRVRDDEPALVILDPLRRIYSGNESSSDGMSAVLGQLRRIQRQYHVAILITHHVTKQSEFDPVSGHSMRGSGDIHAWGDANMYAWRSKQDENVTIVRLEHRNAPRQDPFRLRRTVVTTPSGGTSAYLEYVEGEVSPNAPVAPTVNKVDELRQRVLAKLDEAGSGIGFSKLREPLGVSAERLSGVLRQLEGEGLIAKAKRAWSLRSVPAPEPKEGPVRNGAEAALRETALDRTIKTVAPRFDDGTTETPAAKQPRIVVNCAYEEGQAGKNLK